MTLTRLRAALLAVLFGLVSTMPAWAEIKDWSTTAGSNATITDSTYGNIGFAEGQAPSTLNDSARALMAHVRAWYQGGGWTNLGYTHTYASATSVTVAGTDVTAQYQTGRRVKAVGSSTGTIYGRVSSSSFSTNTTINFQWDSGSLSSETLAVSVGFFNATGSPSPSDLAGALNLAKGANVASAASPSATDIWAPAGNLVHVTGTNSMGSFGTAPQAGAVRIVIFDGAATLIHSASGIVLPGAANITTAANDIALVIADTTTKHLVAYFKADGTAVVAPTAYTPNRQVWTTTGTFSKSSVTNGATHIRARCWGGGGGGGGGHTAASSRGTGGGGGGYSEERLALSALASSEDVTVGTGGAGGAAGSPGSVGTAGGTSSFGTTPFFSATGGTGGAAGNGSAQAGVAGGAGSNGDINLTGGGSEITQGGAAEAPKGGSAAGGGGQGGWRNVATDGLAPGGGGSAGNHSGGSGGAGAAGMCIAEW